MPGYGDWRVPQRYRVPTACATEGCSAWHELTFKAVEFVAVERRRRNVYDKKPQRYAKDNRTAHLTARSDKSVAYVTNNKRQGLLDVLYY